MIIAYCADRGIYKVLPTAINSLLQNNPNVKYIYILAEDDSIPNVTHSKIKVINCNNYDFLVRDGMNCTRLFPYMAMTRCFLPDILTNENKILYLDADTIVDKDLSELWNFNLGSNIFGARKENYVTDYANSGVLLMRLDILRAVKSKERFTRLLKNCRLLFPDQDAIDILFKGKIASIPEKFNIIGKAKDGVYEKDISIRHYAGITKPWKKEANELDKAFWNKYYVDSI